MQRNAKLIKSTSISSLSDMTEKKAANCVFDRYRSCPSTLSKIGGDSVRTTQSNQRGQVVLAADETDGRPDPSDPYFAELRRRAQEAQEPRSPEVQEQIDAYYRQFQT